MDGHFPELFEKQRTRGRATGEMPFRLTVGLVLAFLWPFLTPAQTTPPAPRWRYAGGDVAVRELSHRLETVAEVTTPVERITIEAGAGTAVYYLLPLSPAPLITEMKAAVALKSRSPGLQLFLSVVLPRARHPQTGEPLTVLVPGGQYRVPGEWEWLTVTNIGPVLEREVRTLRLQLRRDIDVREAYADGLVLNLYGGPGTTDVLVGDVQLEGFLPLNRGPQAASPYPESPGQSGGIGSNHGTPFNNDRISRGTLPLRPERTQRDWLNTPLGSGKELDWSVTPRSGADILPAQHLAPPPIEMVGSVLRVKGRPFFPRALEYHGEPLDLVRQLGFNTIWIREPVEERLLLEARQQGLMVILRPDPKLFGLAQSGVQRTIGSSYDGVLAWDMGTQLSPQNVEELKGLAEQIRSVDPMANRPILAEPLTQLLPVSRAVDVLLIGRNPCFSDLELTDYGTWLRSRPLLARPGTPVWVTVPTQPDPGVLSQWERWGLSADQLNRIPADQVRLLTYLALTAGARGLLFRSQSSLACPDEATRERCIALELLNRELEWIDPFLAAGQFLSMVPSDQREVIGALFRTDRARLLVPLWLGRRAQYVPGQSAADQVTFVIPGVPESNSAYLLLPNSLEPLEGERVAGGMRVKIKEFGPTSLIVLTQDPVVLGFLMDGARTAGPRIVQLERELAEMTFRQVQKQHQVLMKYGPFVPQADSWFRMAAQEMAAADKSVGAGDYPAAFRHVHRAMRPVLLIRRVDWEAFALSLDNIVAWPCAVSFDTLLAHLKWTDQLSEDRARPTLLPGGDFEAGGQITAMGWQPFQHAIPGIVAQAELSPSAARSGSFGLLISVRATQPQREQALVESPPIWIESPPVAVQPGDWVCIEGWISIPRAITGSVDGLMIVDSLGGEVLARRMSQTVGWQPFRLYRRAGNEGQVRITLVMTGLGEVCLDDLAVTVIPTDGPSQQPPVPDVQPLVPTLTQPLAGVGR
ncbi:MAG TPA: hypothetical protein PLD05_08270 [Thermogutta sp.]|nr:hypothetical protein [Thermogutta sp.]